MEQLPNKKQEFAKQKEEFSKKVDEPALEQTKLVKTTMKKFEKKASTDLKIEETKALSSQGAIANSESLKSINQKFKDFKSENPDAKLFESLRFTGTILKGDKFAPIKELKCVFEDKSEMLEHKEGVVYLIDFWATWCGPCQRPMQHNQEMLEKNEEKWKGKVEIYGVSLDDSVDDVKKRVEARKWHLVKHYLNSNDENIGNYEVNGIPTIYIIDQKGIVAYNGHPMSINVEEFINNLLEKGAEEKAKKEMLAKEKFKEMKTQIEEFLKQTITKEDKFQLNISFKKKKIFDSKWNVLEKKYKNPFLSYVVKIKHNDKLQAILKQLFEKYPKTEFKIKKEQVIDTCLQEQNCIKFATNQLKEKELTQIPTLNLVKQHKLKFVPRQKQGMIQKTAKLKFGSTKPFPPSAAEKVKKFNEEIQQFKSKAKFKEDAEILNSLYAQSKIAVDDPFFSIKGYKITIPKEEKVEEKKEEKAEEKKEEKAEEKDEKKEEKEEKEEKKEEKEEKEEKAEQKEEKAEQKEEKQKQIVTIEHTPGQVLLVDFWATWCPPCQGPMQHNQEMLEKHKEDWGNKVRIVAASLDQEESAVIKRAQEKKWLDIEYIILNEEEFQESPRIYGVRGIPFIVIVNKQGKIKYMGHPSQAKAEELIQKLLDEEEAKEEEEKKEEKQQKGAISKEQFTKLVALQKEYLPIFREKVKDEEFGPTVLFKFIQEVKYDLEGQIVGEPIYIARKLMLKMYETQYNKFKEFSEFVEKIDQIVKKEDFEAEFTLELEKSITIEFGKECDNCKKALAPTDKQYYCYFHKLYFCYECGNKVDDAKKGNSKYLHPCNMVYINVINDSGMKNIDEYKFGKNIQYESNDQIHSYCCNGCGGGGMERYVCLTPGPMRPGGFVDLCEHCTKILDERNLESDEYKKVHEGVMDEKHDEQTHVLLRIVFGKGNYYKY